MRPLFYCSGLKGSASTALPERPPSLEACGGSVAAAVRARGGGSGGVAGGGTLVDGGGYLRNCVGGARTVCAATSQTLYGFSSGLAGSDDAGSLSSVSFSEHRLSLPRVEVYEAVATAMGEIRV